MNEDLARARALLASALELAPAAVPDDAAIGTLEAWDSLAHMRLIAGIEKALGRELPAGEVVAIASLADVAAILDGKPA
jgi:acyl carrier protein